MKTYAPQSPAFGVTLREAGLTRAGYLFLSVLVIVVFEGSIRKWVSSSATVPLIMLRDVLALYLIFHVWKRGMFKRRAVLATALLAWSACVALWGMLQVIVNDGSPLMLLVGLRFWLLYIWFGYAAAVALTDVDYRISVRFTAGLLLLLAPLALLQYYSPPGARINAEIDSVEDEVFVAVAGVVRTTGTFSFTSGYTTFLALAAPLVFGVIGARKRTLKQLLFAGALLASLIVGTVVSGSRTAVIFSGALLALFLGGRLLFSRAADKGKALLAAVAVLFAVAVFGFIFQGAIDTTQQRFEQAAEAENFTERVLTLFIGESTIYRDFTWIGLGVGVGSNLANYVRAGGGGVLLLAESEAGRVLLEGGLLGYLFAAVKLTVLLIGLYRSLMLAMRSGILHPLLLWVTFTLAWFTWPTTGQLTANALLGVVLAFAAASLKYAKVEIFPSRRRR